MGLRWRWLGASGRHVARGERGRRARTGFRSANGRPLSLRNRCSSSRARTGRAVPRVPRSGPTGRVPR